MMALRLDYKDPYDFSPPFLGSTLVFHQVVIEKTSSKSYQQA